MPLVDERSLRDRRVLWPTLLVLGSLIAMVTLFGAASWDRWLRIGRCEVQTTTTNDWTSCSSDGGNLSGGMTWKHIYFGPICLQVIWHTQ